jgi:hypothetical protein
MSEGNARTTTTAATTRGVPIMLTQHAAIARHIGRAAIARHIARTAEQIARDVPTPATEATARAARRAADKAVYRAVEASVCDG